MVLEACWAWDARGDIADEKVVIVVAGTFRGRVVGNSIRLGMRMQILRRVIRRRKSPNSVAAFLPSGEMLGSNMDIVWRHGCEEGHSERGCVFEICGVGEAKARGNVAEGGLMFLL